MTNLSKFDIMTLEHLADGNDHEDIPKGMTPAQYFNSLSSLDNKGLVKAAFVEGGSAEAAHIKMFGRATLDEINDKKESILRNLFRDYDLNRDEYVTLSHLYKTGRFELVLDGIDKEYDINENLRIPLSKKGYIDYSESYQLIFSRNGKSKFEDLNSELYEQLSNYFSGIGKSNYKPTPTVFLATQDDLLESLDEEQISVLAFLSDGKEHFDVPVNMDSDDYNEICDELENMSLLIAPLTKDNGYKISRKGKKLYKQILSEKLKQSEQDSFENYFAEKTNAKTYIKRLHEKIDPIMEAKAHGFAKNAMMYINACAKYQMIFKDIKHIIITKEFGISKTSYCDYKFEGTKEDYVEQELLDAYNVIKNG